MKLWLKKENKLVDVKCLRKFKMYGLWWGVHRTLTYAFDNVTVFSCDYFSVSEMSLGVYTGSRYYETINKAITATKKHLRKYGKKKILAKYNNTMNPWLCFFERDGVR